MKKKLLPLILLVLPYLLNAEGDKSSKNTSSCCNYSFEIYSLSAEELSKLQALNFSDGEFHEKVGLLVQEGIAKLEYAPSIVTKMGDDAEITTGTEIIYATAFSGTNSSNGTRTIVPTSFATRHNGLNLTFSPLPSDDNKVNLNLDLEHTTLLSDLSKLAPGKFPKFTSRILQTQGTIELCKPVILGTMEASKNQLVWLVFLTVTP